MGRNGLINRMLLSYLFQQGTSDVFLCAWMLFYLQPKYKNAFAMFKVYEKDLHTPIHLENNILFAKAIIMD